MRDRFNPFRPVGAYLLAFVAVLACDPAKLVEVDPPGTVVDPAVVTTASGALQLHRQAITLFSRHLGGSHPAGDNFGTVVLASAMFTDEFMENAASGQFGYINTALDRRNSPADYAITHSAIHRVRTMARQARDALRLYAPDTYLPLQGQMYALEGFTVVWLAENFCSGIPLTVVPLVGSPQPTPGFTTEEMFERAVALLDSALTLAGDSVRFANLARVGKGRALLGLGRQADAAAAVGTVPTDFVYGTDFANGVNMNLIGNRPRIGIVVDNEGGNGLEWSTDPRTATVVLTETGGSGTHRVSAKYSLTPSGTLDPNVPSPGTPIRVADGLEARLIEAEAALASGNANWLTMLNTLRATCVGNAPCAPLPGLTSDQLPPLVDPGSAAARLDLLMQERAMWLYLTGHRQGDLRRMARVYGRDPLTLWPTGTYIYPLQNPGVPASQIQSGTPYGTDVVWNPNLSGTVTEMTANPLYSGCFDMNP